MTNRSRHNEDDQVPVNPDAIAEYEAWAANTGLAASPDPACLNCGASLRGQYCGQCGQRAGARRISFWELVRDAFGDLFELDSRLWRTLVPLMIRPGLLTHDYLQGRRARYMPPFRMYLVLSLLFFLVAFFNPRESLGIFFEPADELAHSDAERADRDLANEVADELAAEGIVVGRPAAEPDATGNRGINIRINDDGTADTSCDIDDMAVDGPEWLKRRLTPQRLQQICLQIQQDKGRRFVANLLDNLPAALFILLPVMALVLKALYPLSRRYYVEHLLFFVHFHAFFFLILVLEVLLARLTAALPVLEWIGNIAIIAASIYIPVYLFISMRRVYGQGRFLTFLKYSLLVFAYLAGFTFTMLGAVTMAAFAI